MNKLTNIMSFASYNYDIFMDTNIGINSYKFYDIIYQKFLLIIPFIGYDCLKLT